MESPQNELQQVELSIDQAKASIDKMKSLQTLSRNKEFVEIVHKDYFEKEASRLVLLRADDSMQDDESQKSINNQMIAIGYLRQYFQTIMQLGNMATNALKADEATREEILEEDAA